MPITASGFVAAIGRRLIADLTHPARFYLIFTRHHEGHPPWQELAGSAARSSSTAYAA
jgi:hypothetical protein